MKEIRTRRSVRKFKSEKIKSEQIETIIRAGMQAPTILNRQPWEFIVVEDRAMLEEMSVASPYAMPVASSGATILVLVNEERLKVPKSWEQEMGACVENMLLETVHLGLGGLWLGVATAEAVKINITKLFHLPKHIIPFAMVAIGYPDGEENKFVDKFEAERIHYEKW